MEEIHEIQMKQKMDNIENNLQFIKNNLDKINQTIFIELVGTPKSGKTTLSKALGKMFENKGIKFQVRQGTAEYNPVEDKETEEYNVWMIAEILKNLSEDMGSKELKIVLYDKGILDTIPWLDCAVVDGSISCHDEHIINSIFDTDFMKGYRPLVYNFLTSPETSTTRKGKEGRIVNKKSIGTYNKFLLQNKDFIASSAKRYHFVETDHYQGKIREFLIDMSEIMTQDVRERIREEMDYNDIFENKKESENTDYEII